MRAMHLGRVLVVGAGPVELALATDLGRRGVRTTLVERERAHSPLPRMNLYDDDDTPEVDATHVELPGDGDGDGNLS